MPNRKSLIDLATLCERRAKTVESEGDREQLKLIAAQLKEMSERTGRLTVKPRPFSVSAQRPSNKTTV